MIYLDHAANTKVDKEVLDKYYDTALNYYGNPNANHEFGKRSQKLIEESTNIIAKTLNILPEEIIYTSGATESNNLAIKGICERYKNYGKHILVSCLEHTSIIASATVMQELGFEVELIPVDKNGLINIETLKQMIRNDTILVSVCSVDSELGLVQPIEEIGKIVKEYPKCYFHSDMTQSIGKVNVPMDNVDFISFSAHKFFGVKGIGVLLKKSSIVIDPLIHGGKSTTVYRSGTPALPLIASLSKALRLAYNDFDKKYYHVLELNKYLKDNLKKYGNVFINSNDYSIPHILNISVIGVKPETMLHALEEYEIYISTQSACSSSNTVSKAVLNLTHDEERAKSSIRISISYLTTKKEIDLFLDAFDKCYNKLV